MTSAWLHQLGALLKQAEKRLGEIDNERSQILAAFPQLKKGRKPYKSKGHAVLFDAAKAEQTPKPSSNVGRKWDAETRAKAVERLRAGEYPVDIAKSMGMSSGSVVEKWGTKAGVAIPKMSKDEMLRRMSEGRVPGTPRPQGMHVDPDTRTKALDLIAQGRSNAQIATAVGVSHTSIKRWRMGRIAEQHNGHTHPKRPPISKAHRITTAGKGIAPDVVAKALELIGNGQANARIAKQLGIGKSTVRRLREQRKREAQS